MRIGIDYTSAARQGGGIGRYTRELVTAVIAEGADSYCEAAPQACQHRFVLFAGTQGLGDRWKTEAARLRRVAAPGQLTLRQVPLTDEWMARIWQRLRLPIPAELITGRLDLFYAPDFLLPPLFPPRQQYTSGTAATRLHCRLTTLSTIRCQQHLKHAALCSMRHGLQRFV
mgnify:CR=1 FL=1